jgi:hypothetical protein
VCRFLRGDRARSQSGRRKQPRDDGDYHIAPTGSRAAPVRGCRGSPGNS